MSDKRATYAIGAIVVAFALVLGTVAGSTSLTPISVASQDPMQMTGHVILTLTDADDNIKAYRQTDNIIVHNGMDCSADLLFGDFSAPGLCTTPGFWTFIAIGEDGTALDVTDPGLGTEITTANPGRGGALTAELPAATTVGAKKTVEQAFIIGATGTVKEVGLFDIVTSNGGNMLSRLLITPNIPVLTGDTVTIEYVVEVG